MVKAVDNCRGYFVAVGTLSKPGDGHGVQIARDNIQPSFQDTERKAVIKKQTEKEKGYHCFSLEST